MKRKYNTVIMYVVDTILILPLLLLLALKYVLIVISKIGKTIVVTVEEGIRFIRVLRERFIDVLSI